MSAEGSNREGAPAVERGEVLGGVAKHEARAERLSGDEGKDKVITDRRAALTDAFETSNPDDAQTEMYRELWRRATNLEQNLPEDSRPLPPEMLTEESVGRTKNLLRHLALHDKGLSLSKIVERGIADDSPEATVLLRELGARMLQLNGPRTDDEGSMEKWKTISEERKQYIREGEMLILASEMSEVRHHARSSANHPTADLDVMRDRYNRFVKYARNQDVPDRFRVMLLDCSAFILEQYPRLAEAHQRSVAAGNKLFEKPLDEAEGNALRARAHAFFEARADDGRQITRHENLFAGFERDHRADAVARAVEAPPVTTEPGGEVVADKTAARKRSAEAARDRRRSVEYADEVNLAATQQLERWHHMRTNPARQEWLQHAMRDAGVEGNPRAERRRQNMLAIIRSELDYGRMPSRDLGDQMKRGFQGFVNRVRVCGWPFGAGARRKMEEARSDLAATLRLAATHDSDLDPVQQATMGQLALRLEEITLAQTGQLESSGAEVAAEHELVATGAEGLTSPDDLFAPDAPDPLAGDDEAQDPGLPGDESADDKAKLLQKLFEIEPELSGPEARKRLRVVIRSRTESTEMIAARRLLQEQIARGVDPVGGEHSDIGLVLQAAEVPEGEPDALGREKRRRKMTHNVLQDIDYGNRLAEGGLVNTVVIPFDRWLTRFNVCGWPFGKRAQEKMTQAREDVIASLRWGITETDDLHQRAALKQLALAVKEVNLREQSARDKGSYAELASPPDSITGTPPDPGDPGDFEPLKAGPGSRWSSKKPKPRWHNP